MKNEITLAIGDLTNEGIYMGGEFHASIPNLYRHMFKNIHGGISYLPNLRGVEVITEEKLNEKISNKNNAMKDHFANLPAYVMD